MITSIYLDYNATTPCDKNVIEKMLPFYDEVYGNPANGLHQQGRKAAQAVGEARDLIAELIGANSTEIYFTSGATESNNLAILGLARSKNFQQRTRIVTSQIEHKAVLLPCQKLEQEGYEVINLPVDSDGCVNVEDAKAAINSNTLLVSIQSANNEIGTIQPIAEIAKTAHEYGALMHSDGAQMVGKLPVNMNKLGVDLFSMSAHKFYGPKGIGALFIRGGYRSIPLAPLIYGGGQENGLRPGTSNVPAIVGIGEACRIASKVLPRESNQLAALHDQLEKDLLASISPLKINGYGAPRLPNTSSLTFPGIDADALLLNMPRLMMGTGSACSSGTVEPSYVLTSIGLSREDAFSTIRLCIGRYTTGSDIRVAAREIETAWQLLKINP